MGNAGIYNSSFTCVLVLLMFLPMFLFMLTQLFASIGELYPSKTTNNNFEICVQKATEEVENITFEDIKIATLRKAANGDKAARDWAMKYVFDVQPNDKSVDAQKYNTDQAIIDDAIEAMVAVKVKRKDAVQKIKSLVAKKDYKNVSDLFVDAISFN